MVFNTSIKKKIFFLGLIFLIQIPIILPFFHKGFFPNHDNVQIVRSFEMFQALKYGGFPPRWSSGLLYGYGYPLFTFYSPLAYFISSIFVFFGLNFLLATKAVFILAFLAGALGVFLLIREWWGDLSAFVSALVFSYAPYRAVDVYVRGNLSEFLAFSLLPFSLLTNWKLVTGEKKGFWGLLFSLSVLVLVLSHNLTSFMAVLFLFFFNLFYFIKNRMEDNKKNILNIFLAGILILMLSCFYWLPLLYEQKYVLLSKFAHYPYQKFFLTLGQIWDTPWGFNGFTEPKPMSLQLGKVLIVFVFMAFFANIIKKTKFRSLIFFLGGAFAGFTFLELKTSEFIWKTIPLFSFLQFPWRLHVLTTLIGAILFGSFFYLGEQSVSKLKTGKNFKILFYLTLLISLFLHVKENIGFFKPRLYSDDPAVSETTTWDDEYLPVWVKTKPKDYAVDKAVFVKGKGEIEVKSWGYLKKSFELNSMEDSIIQISHIFYPGWTAFVNGQKTAISYNNDQGLMQVSLPAGQNNVNFVFLRTPIILLSETISLFGLAIFIILLIREIQKLISEKKPLLSK